MNSTHDEAIARARIAYQRQQFPECDAALRAALIAAPDSHEAHAMMGMLLSERTVLVPGAWHLRRALAGDRHPQLLATLGHNLLRQGMMEEAEALLREATDAMPDALLPLAHHAVTLERLDRLNEARAVLDHAKAVAARSGQNLMLQDAMLIARTAAWRDALAMLDAVPTLDGGAMLNRGRLRDRAGRYDDAWRDFVEGKASLARETGLRYQRDGVHAHMTKLASFFIPERFASLPRASVRGDTPQPIFILGFPRSGTTMAEQLVTSHPRIRPGDELPFTGELVEFAANQTGSFPDGLAGLAVADRHHVVTLFRDFYLARAETYGLLAPGADWFTDKMPLNDTYLPLLRLAFPAAKIISVRRHPLDILVSVMSHSLTHGFNCGFAIEDAAHQLAAASALMAQWEALGIGMHRFVYERFIADQAGETARLMAYLDLDVDPTQARFHESKRFAPTPSYAQVREPLYDRSIGRWRHYAHNLAPIVDVVRPAMERDGYSD